MTIMPAIARSLPRKLRLELILTGRLMSATEAVAQGVVNRVVASGELEVATAALARSAATRFRPPRTTPTPA
jgi:enoyl-CoA hydratase/carnithine racemase